MNDCFTIERVDGETFVISEYKHWEEPHCYLLLGRERVLLIDTSLGAADIRREAGSFTELSILAAVTHAH